MFHKNTRHYLLVACTLLINTHITGADTSNPKNDEEKFVIQTTELTGHQSCTSGFYQIKSKEVPPSSINSSELNHQKVKVWTTNIEKTYLLSGHEYSGTITETFIPSHLLPKETPLTPQSCQELFKAIESYHVAKRTSNRYQKIDLSVEQEDPNLKEVIALQRALIKTIP